MEKLQVRTNLNRNQVINAIVKCWAIVAKCSRLAFKNSLTNNDYIVLEKYLKMEQKALIELRMDRQLEVDTPEVNSIFEN
ncbi:17638_t:CDS:2 [Rhizophagus irregularis]|nr:17638_t:CDS:2 [Rhizophagus irregularis]